MGHGFALSRIFPRTSGTGIPKPRINAPVPAKREGMRISAGALASHKDHAHEQTATVVRKWHENSVKGFAPSPKSGASS